MHSLIIYDFPGYTLCLVNVAHSSVACSLCRSTCSFVSGLPTIEICWSIVLFLRKAQQIVPNIQGVYPVTSSLQRVRLSETKRAATVDLRNRIMASDWGRAEFSVQGFGYKISRYVQVFSSSPPSLILSPFVLYSLSHGQPLVKQRSKPRLSIPRACGPANCGS